MKQIILFSLILMLGLNSREVNASDTVGTPDYPCIATVYQNVNEDFVFDATGYNITPFNNAYVTFDFQGNQVVRIRIDQDNIWLLHRRYGDYFDLPVSRNGVSEYNACIRIIFVE